VGSAPNISRCPKTKELIRKKNFGTNIVFLCRIVLFPESQGGGHCPSPPGPLSWSCDLLLDVDHRVILLLPKFGLHLGEKKYEKIIEILVAIQSYYDTIVAD
jgi:hypothetical protein